MALAIAPHPVFQRQAVTESASRIAVALAISFLALFLICQTYALLQSTQASQVQTESFKIERESSRKEFSPTPIETFLSALIGKPIDIRRCILFSAISMGISFAAMQHAELLLTEQSAARGPPSKK